jgi:hypothetical protein
LSEPWAALPISVGIQYKKSISRNCKLVNKRNLLLKLSNNTIIGILYSKMYLWLMKLMVDNAKPDPHASPLAIFNIEINFAYECTQAIFFIFVVIGKELPTHKEQGKRVM